MGTESADSVGVWRGRAASVGRRVLDAVAGVSPTGLILAVALFDASLAPSLLVRTWVFQGVLSGVCIAIGYGVGRLLEALGARLLGVLGASPSLGRRPRLVLFGLAVALAASGVYAAAGHHRWTWDRLGYDPSLTVATYLGAIALAGASAAVLFGVAWLIGLLQRWVARLGAPLLPAWIASALALVLVLWAVVAATNTWVLQRTLSGLNDSFAAADLDVDESTPQPSTDALRSGSAQSLVMWKELGHEGREFLTHGPDADEIAGYLPAATPSVEPQEPIRVFVGRASAETVQGRVDLAMAELERLDAFSRRAVAVVVPTGTGWVNEQIVAPPEYFFAGSTATVAVQYSHLPSPMAYLAEHESAKATGTLLIDAVRTRLDTVPAASRPDLLVAGESLGSFGGAEAFEDFDDLLDRTRASLWIGPPDFMHLRAKAEAARAPGSPQIRPRIGDGTDVVFVNRRSDLEGTSPRSVFLQQADDPIVWWDVPTLSQRPDWLEEPLDPAVNPEMSWRPFATFLNLTVDMVVGNEFDEDHGHLYGTQPLAAWAAMLSPTGWDDTTVERLRAHLAELER